MTHSLNTLLFPNTVPIHGKCPFQDPDEMHLQEALPNVPDQKQYLISLYHSQQAVPRALLRFSSHILNAPHYIISF